MKVTRKSEEYAEIINMQRPRLGYLIPMAIGKRAAQFAPFAALNGFAEVVEETAKLQQAVAGGAVI